MVTIFTPGRVLDLSMGVKQLYIEFQCAGNIHVEQLNKILKNIMKFQNTVHQS